MALLENPLFCRMLLPDATRVLVPSRARVRWRSVLRGLSSWAWPLNELGHYNGLDPLIMTFDQIW